MTRFPVVCLVGALAACATADGGPVGPGPGPGPSGPPVAVPFRLGSTQPEEARAVAVTATSIVVASWFTGTLDFDPRVTASGKTSFGAQDVAVAFYSHEGELQQVFSIGGSGADVPSAMAATPDGGVVVVGYGNGGGLCGGRVLTSQGGRDLLLLKLGAGGSCEWGRLIGGTQDDEARAVAVAPDGSILVSGLFRGTVDFDPTGGTAILVSRGSSDAFLARYTMAGDFVDVAQIGGPLDDAASAIAVAQDGEIAVAGEFRGNATVGSELAPVVLASIGGGDYFVARYTELFGLRWALRGGGGGEDRATALAHDGNGDLLVAGTFESTADLDPGAGAALVVSFGAADAFLASYSSSAGTWNGLARAWGGIGSEGVTGLVRHISGRIILTGYFQESVDFDPGPAGRIVNAKGTGGAGDGFAMAFASTGEFAWVAPVGGVVGGAGSLSIAYGLALDATGGVWTTGRFYGRSDFDPSETAVELASSGDSDQFVSRYAVENGTLLSIPLPD